MKWVLLWVALGSNNELTSGSVSFDSQKACVAAIEQQEILSFKLSRGGINTRAICINSETGDAAGGKK